MSRSKLFWILICLYFISSDFAPAQSGPATQPAWRINVRDCGAKGDGKTDDSAAIQKAIDAVPRYQGKHWKMGVVFFPPGEYLVSRTIVLPPQMYLEGVHPWSSTLVLAKKTFTNPKAPKAMIEIPRGYNGWADTCFTPGIRNLGFTHLGDNPGGVFVLFNCAQVGHIRDCLFSGGNDAGAMWADIWMPKGGGNNALIQGCEIRGGRVGIRMEGHSDGVILKCSVQHQTEWGIEIIDCYRGVELIGIQGEIYNQRTGLIKIVNSNVSITGANLWGETGSGTETMIETVDSNLVAMNLRGRGFKNLLIDKNSGTPRTPNHPQDPGHDGTKKRFRAVKGNPKGWSNCIFYSSNQP
jgi:hypothetical protein